GCTRHLHEAGDLVRRDDRMAGPRSFGVILRQHRRIAGLTQEALAERAGLSARTIADLERGVNRSPRRDTLPLLADALALDGPARMRFEAAARQMGDTVPPTPPETSPSLPPLVGRTHEVSLLERHLAGV